MTFKKVEAIVLTEDDIRSLVSFPEALSIAEELLANQGSGAVDMPPKVALDLKRFGLESYCNSMPAYLHYKKLLGIKFGGGFSDNVRTGQLPYMVQTLILANPVTGEPYALMSATYLTILKTGTETAVSAKFLAKQDGALKVCVIGVGDQGQGNALAWAALDAQGARKVSEIGLVDLDTGKAEQFAKVLERSYKGKIQVSGSIEKSVADRDVIVTTTTAVKPIVKKEWVKPQGVYFASLGSNPELDPQIVLSADKLVADNWVQNEHRGEFRELIATGKITRRNLYAELPEIVAGKQPGRVDPKENIVGSLIGLGSIDIATAWQAYLAAKERGIGQKVRLM
ncbi:MAG: ornithine cyclodeaminase family protein [Candidatus Bipolaricaulota bacterium]|nr:ornithine cyclodeaminase family protein [Candidatus Bipolaricaulota bacterium]